MRKLLLASAAMLSGTVALASVASAQLYTVGGPTPVPVSGSVGAPGTTIPTFTTNPPLAPGSYTVRLSGRLTGIFSAVSDSGRDPTAITTTAKTAPIAPPTATKLSDYQFGEYARLYPSFDAVAANGLKYGAFLEIRQDNQVAPGGGVNGGTASSANGARGALYFRRETGYIGTDQYGFLRFGATDQPTSLFATGTFENFDDNAWNFATIPGPFTSNAVVYGPFPDVGALYTTSKVVYLSPKFFDMVDFGVSFAPNTGNDDAQAGNCPYANTAAGATSVTGTSSVGTGCDATSSTNVSGENKRPRNTVDAVARLRTAVGPAGVAATVGGFYSGAVQYNGTAPATGPTGVPRYNGYGVFDSGLQVTFGGLAVGGHLDYGQYNGTNFWTLQPKEGRDGFAYLVGSSYAFGSLVVGASYFNNQTAGYWTTTTSFSNGYKGGYAIGRTLNQSGVAAGGTLTVAPGAYVFLSYLYGQKHQTGVDLVTNVVGAESHNDVHAQALMLGTQFRW